LRQLRIELNSKYSK